LLLLLNLPIAAMQLVSSRVRVGSEFRLGFSCGVVVNEIFRRRGTKLLLEAADKKCTSSGGEK